jgi:hypothetical protein
VAEDIVGVVEGVVVEGVVVEGVVVERAARGEVTEVMPSR